MIENLFDLVNYNDGQIASRSLSVKLGIDNPMTLYAMAKGESISGETSDKTKLIQVLEGSLEITTDTKTYQLTGGSLLTIASQTLHHFLALENTKLLQLELFS